MSKRSVHAVLPRAGLANRLLVWARAAVYAKTNDLPLYVQGWGHIHIGPLLRREKSMRYYGTFFNCPGYLKGVARLKQARWFQAASVVTEPPFSQPPAENTKCIVFQTVPSKEDYFADLRGHEEFLGDAFRAMVRQRWHQSLPNQSDPFIALHVRRGDFRTAGIELSSEDYFAKTLSRLRAASGIERAVVFSDATAAQVPQLAGLPNVTFAEHNSEILDLLEMSRADIIVTSLRSTFGYWGGFISKASIILDPRHDFGAIRDTSNGWFEGNIDQFEDAAAKRT